MPSSDPWADLPNLAGVTSPGLDESRIGDPARVYPAPRGGQVDAVTGRILDMPRCKVYNTTGYPGQAAGSTPFMGWNGIEYDTDGMTKSSSLAVGTIYFTTPGFYLVTASVEYNATASYTYTRILKNASTTTQIAQLLTPGTTPLGADSVHTLGGYAPFLAGETAALMVSSNAGYNIAGGQYTLWLAACMISSTGSDNQ